MIRDSVSIIILNWNQKDLTRRCLESVGRLRHEALHVIVVDNGSSDGSVEELSRDFPSVEFLPLGSNQGVAGGRNRGMERALERGDEYVLLLDNDTVADPGFLDPMLRRMRQDPGTAMTVPKIFELGEDRVIQRAGCPSWKLYYLSSVDPILQFAWERLGRHGHQHWWDLSRGWGQQDRGQFDRDEEIAFSIGACQMIRASALRAVGPLDERFNPYGGEDIDFCARLSEAGYRIVYVHDAVIWHRKESSFTDSYQRTYYNANHILLLARKHLRGLSRGLFWLDLGLLNLPLKMTSYAAQRQWEKLRGLTDAVRDHVRSKPGEPCRYGRSSNSRSSRWARGESLGRRDRSAKTIEARFRAAASRSSFTTR